jgi:hypothetical protein
MTMAAVVKLIAAELLQEAEQVCPKAELYRTSMKVGERHAVRIYRHAQSRDPDSVRWQSWRTRSHSPSHATHSLRQFHDLL